MWSTPCPSSFVSKNPTPKISNSPHTQNQKIVRARPIFLAFHQFVTIDTSFASSTFNWTHPSLVQNDEIKFQWFMKSWSWCRVNWPIINHLPMTEHFGRSFSILLHFEWFKMLYECFLKLYKSSLKCKAKGLAKKELSKKKMFFSNCKMHFFSFFFLLTPSTFKPHNFLISYSF